MRLRACLGISGIVLGIWGCSDSGGGDVPAGTNPGTPVAIVEPESVKEERATLGAALDGVAGLSAEGLLGRYATAFQPAPHYEPEAAFGLSLIQASKLALNESELTALRERGFVISDRLRSPSFAYGYATIYLEDRAHRLAYVLGEILELPAPEAAEVLEIEAPALRKRLQRARAEVEAFTRAHCGLVSDRAACRCNRRVPAAVELGRARPDALAFAERAVSFEDIRAVVRRVERARWALEVQRASRPRSSEVDFARRVVSALESSLD